MHCKNGNKRDAITNFSVIHKMRPSPQYIGDIHRTAFSRLALSVTKTVLFEKRFLNRGNLITSALRFSKDSKRLIFLQSESSVFKFTRASLD